MENKGKTSNRMIAVLLAVLIVAVLIVGGYFIIKDLNNKNNGNGQTNNTMIDENGNASGNNVPPAKSDSSSGEPTSATPTMPTDEQSNEQSNELDAGITYSEVRGNDYYIEVQVNGQVNGTCDISLMPTNGSQGHHDDDDLEIRNKVSVCDEDFSLKGMNPGEHKITVIIRTVDGRTKTLEKIVNV